MQQQMLASCSSFSPSSIALVMMVMMNFLPRHCRYSGAPATCQSQASLLDPPPCWLVSGRAARTALPWTCANSIVPYRTLVAQSRRLSLMSAPEPFTVTEQRTWHLGQGCQLWRAPRWAPHPHCTLLVCCRSLLEEAVASSATPSDSAAPLSVAHAAGRHTAVCAPACADTVGCCILEPSVPLLSYLLLKLVRDTPPGAVKASCQHEAVMLQLRH